MSPASAKTSAPSASQVFTYTKGAALISAPRALPRWKKPWSVEVRGTTQICTKNVSVNNLVFYPFLYPCTVFYNFSLGLLILD